MVNLVSELIESLKEHNFSINIKDVRDVYSSKKPVYPMIVIDEVTNNPYLQLHGDEKLSNIGYKFEIYCRDMSIEGKLITKREAVISLSKELDDFLRKTYGFKRSVNPVILPYTTDGSIIRWVSVYSGIIDTKNGYIYQR